MDEILDITFAVVGVFDRLGVPYLIGGSLASSLHGIPRATLDVDLIAALRHTDIAGLVAALRDSFYLDEDAIRDAVDRHTSFNLIHLGSYFKADVFVAKEDEPTRLQMARRQRFVLDGSPPREIVVASPEDVAQKLAWFALGDRIAERQWSDAVGVLKVAAPNLDVGYLRRVSALLGVEPLLEDAWRAAGLSA